MTEQRQVEFASLAPEQVARVQELEEKVGALVLAYKTPLEPAPLSDDQLAMLRAMEKEMPGICLVAYKTLPRA